MILPARLQPGAVIGIVSPSSPVNIEDLEKGIACFRERGYSVVEGPHVRDRHHSCDYLAGTDEGRAADIHSLFAREDVDAIVCSRGGTGSLRLPALLDWDVIRANPKIFVGYSDVTTLHLGIARHAGFVTFHGPMAAAHANLNLGAKSEFWRILESPDPLGLLEPCNTECEIRTLVPGMAEGELAGGCICLLANSCGSAHQPDFTGKIVLLEDVGEAVYKADRNLWQLRNAGILDRAAGFVIGNLTNWRKTEPDPPNNNPQTLFEEFFTPLGKPAVWGYPFGHEPNPLTLPLGVRARLDADARTLTLLAPAVW